MGASKLGDEVSVPAQARLKSSGLSIGELARMARVRPSAIRYYEQRGLLRAPGRRSGRRVYDADAVSRLKAILTARRLGFSIREIEALAQTSVQGWRASATAKAHDLRALIASLGARAAELDALVECNCDSEGVCRL